VRPFIGFEGLHQVDWLILVRAHVTQMLRAKFAYDVRHVAGRVSWMLHATKGRYFWTPQSVFSRWRHDLRLLASQLTGCASNTASCYYCYTLRITSAFANSSTFGLISSIIFLLFFGLRIMFSRVFAKFQCLFLPLSNRNNSSLQGLTDGNAFPAQPWQALETFFIPWRRALSRVMTTLPREHLKTRV
jgi:hypothetical protein